MLTRLVLALLLTSGVAFAQHPEDAFVGQKAPELKFEANMWLNSTPLKLESLKGKVVLVEFWAYDCPQCAQSMPYMKQWHQKYSKDGLVIIGVHTPRIDYEKDVEKVKEAVAQKGIEFPVVIDNKYSIWTDYLCAAWPSHFVVDQEGVIKLSHTGTGRYEDTEKLIQQLLATKKSQDDGQEAKALPNYSLIKGSVFTPEGRLFAGARITVVRSDIEQKQQKKTKKESYSDRSGEFAFRLDVGPAKYVLNIEAKGYASLDREVQISSDERTDISIVLKK